MNMVQVGSSLSIVSSKKNFTTLRPMARWMVRICCATTDSTSSSMRLNSSKQAQAPDCAKPCKGIGMNERRHQSKQHSIGNTILNRVRPEAEKIKLTNRNRNSWTRVQGKHIPFDGGKVEKANSSINIIFSFSWFSWFSVSFSVLGSRFSSVSVFRVPGPRTGEVSGSIWGRQGRPFDMLPFACCNKYAVLSQLETSSTYVHSIPHPLEQHK